MTNETEMPFEETSDQPVEHQPLSDPVLQEQEQEQGQAGDPEAETNKPKRDLNITDPEVAKILSEAMYETHVTGLVGQKQTSLVQSAVVHILGTKLSGLTSHTDFFDLFVGWRVGYDYHDEVVRMSRTRIGTSSFNSFPVLGFADAEGAASALRDYFGITWLQRKIDKVNHLDYRLFVFQA